MERLALSVLPQQLAVCRLDPAAAIPAWLGDQHFWSVTRTADEMSVVLPEDRVPAGCRAEKGWRCLKVLGPLDFASVGILASLSTVLAGARVSIFCLSTYDTDYILVRQADLDTATEALRGHGHTVHEGG